MVAKSSFEEFNDVFLTAAASKISQGSEGFADFSGTFFSMVKKITFLNYGSLCMYKCSTNILHSLSSAIKKSQNAPDLRWILSFKDKLLSFE